MPFIPRQVKPPARLAMTCKVPEEVATLLKQYAAFLDSSQEYVVTETLRLAFHRDKEFQAWLATTHPATVVAARASVAGPDDHPPQTHPPALAPTMTATVRRVSTSSEPSAHRTDHEPIVREERSRP